MTIGVRPAAALLVLFGGSALTGVALGQTSLGQTASRSGEAQVEAGQALYNARCATCHAADLKGHEGPALAGPNFQLRWGQRTPQAMAAYIKSRMPPGQANLSDDQAGDLAAYVLSANGVAPGALASAPSPDTFANVIKAAGRRRP